MVTRIMDLFGKTMAFEATGDAHVVSMKWNAWLKESEAFVDSIGLLKSGMIVTKTIFNKQQCWALLLYTTGREVRETFKTFPDWGEASDYKAIHALNKHYNAMKTNSTFWHHEVKKNDAKQWWDNRMEIWEPKLLNQRSKFLSGSWEDRSRTGLFGTSSPSGESLLVVVVY